MHLVAIKNSEADQSTDWAYTQYDPNSQTARAAEYRQGLIHDPAARHEIARQLFESGVLEELLPVLWADSAEGGYALDTAQALLFRDLSYQLASNDGNSLLLMPNAKSIEHHQDMANLKLTNHRG